MSLWPITTSTPDPNPSPLLLLPPEIRTQIWTHVLTTTLPIVTFPIDVYQHDTLSSATTQPALTQVSRAVRAETLPIWHARNTFVLHTEAEKAIAGEKWLVRRCNSAWAEEVRRVEVWVRYVSPEAGMMGRMGRAGRAEGGMGAFSVEIRRRVKGGKWEVEGVRWITVVRRPVDWEEDVRFLKQEMGSRIEEKLGGEHLTGRQVEAVRRGLKEAYAQWKAER